MASRAMAIDVLRFYGARTCCGNANSRPAADESGRLSYSRDDRYRAASRAWSMPMYCHGCSQYAFFR
jgi:hypothetical protein